MPFLLDTTVVSELRKTSCHGALREWHRRTPATELCLPAIALTEIRMGILNLARQGRHQDAERISQWLATRVLVAYEVVPLGRDAALIWGDMLMSPLRGRGKTFDRDMIIAACAIAEAMPIVSRNIRDFLAIHALFPLPGLLDPTDPAAGPDLPEQLPDDSDGGMGINGEG